jgi:hypothetical protein
VSDNNCSGADGELDPVAPDAQAFHEAEGLTLARIISDPAVVRREAIMSTG